jgi:multicomponent Na+:H+ antiporter subunit B
VYTGDYGRILDATAVAARHATNVVSAVTFDYRGADTMGEEFILFAAVVGVALLLRAQREEVERPPHDEAAGRVVPRPSDAVRMLGLGTVGPVVALGVYVVAHGHLSPGGGFQGGVALAGALMLVYLAGEYLAFKRVGPVEMIDLAEGVGAGGYVVIGVSSLALGSAFLHNFLPLGTIGELDSAGVIPLINVAVALEVAAGFSLLLSEFLEQTLVVRRAERDS